MDPMNPSLDLPLHSGCAYILCIHVSTAACDPMVLGDNPSLLNGSGSVRVSNGIITYTALTPSSVAMLECDPGYRLEFSLNRTCGSDGHWSEEELSCVVVDQSPEILCVYLRVYIIKLYIFRDMYVC